MSLLEAIHEPYRITKPIRLIECFAGIGAQHKALSILGADFDSWRVCEWSVNSIIAYNAIHINDWNDYSQGLTVDELVDKVRGVSADYNQPMTDKQLKAKGERWLRRIYSSMMAIRDYSPDISKLKGEQLGITDRERYTYILTYSFPCQDLSLAGLGKGMAKGTSTRSGLLWQVERILNELNQTDSLPHILVMENVPQVCTGNAIKPFNDWLAALEKLGYTNYYKTINAKDYAIPQNRKRTFMVSILGDWSYTFPDPMKLRHRLKDFLDKSVDESYFLTDRQVESFTYKDESD